MKPATCTPPSLRKEQGSKSRWQASYCIAQKARKKKTKKGSPHYFSSKKYTGIYTLEACMESFIACTRRASVQAGIRTHEQCWRTWFKIMASVPSTGFQSYLTQSIAATWFPCTLTPLFTFLVIYPSNIDRAPENVATMHMGGDVQNHASSPTYHPSNHQDHIN